MNPKELLTFLRVPRQQDTTFVFLLRVLEEVIRGLSLSVSDSIDRKTLAIDSIFVSMITEREA